MPLPVGTLHEYSLKSAFFIGGGVRISSQLLESIKERDAVYKAAGLLGFDFSKRSPLKYQILAQLHITNTRELYALLKRNGYVFDHVIMKWRIK